MVESYKGRKLESGQLVKVYFNLHKKVFSVKCAKTGKVLAHGNNILLSDPVFQVMESGRQRVIKEKRKNVHAYVVGKFAGIVEDIEKIGDEGWTVLDRISYNPYMSDKFINNLGDDANDTNYDYVHLKNKSVHGIHVF